MVTQHTYSLEQSTFPPCGTLAHSMVSNTLVLYTLFLDMQSELEMMLTSTVSSLSIILVNIPNFEKLTLCLVDHWQHWLYQTQSQLLQSLYLGCRWVTADRLEQ